MEDISPFRRPLIPLFWTSGDICPRSQSQGGSLAYFLTCVILRFTSGVTLADFIEVSMAAEPFGSMYLQRYPQTLVEVLLSVRVTVGLTVNRYHQTGRYRYDYSTADHLQVPSLMVDLLGGGKLEEKLNNQHQ